MCYMQLMAKETSFRRWREQMRFTQDQAAEALEVSKSQIANWDAGTSRSRGSKAIPSTPIRAYMTALALGYPLTPWPK